MKIKHFLLSAIVLATSLASCVDDKEYVYDGSNGVKFNSTVAGQSPLNRAANQAWDQGDAIGVYMKTGTGLTNIVDGAANKRHTTPGNGLFAPGDPMTDAIYFPKTGTVDFIAYYPYVQTMTGNIYKVDVTNQVSQEKIDLLYSNDATGKSSGDNVVLGFNHELTKVVLNLTATDATVDLTDVKVVITDMPIKGNYDLATGALAIDGANSNIEMKSTVDPTSKLKALSEAIVIPTSIKADRKITFTFKVNGAPITKTWDDADKVPFAKGTINTYTVQLGGGDKGVLVSPNSNIAPWGPGSSGNIDIDLDGDGGTTVGDGSQTNPFTVEDAALKVGENAQWVTGFIVGSTNTAARAIGTPSKDNIILATTKGETDESKWIIIDIKGSAVAKFLDIVASSDLIGTKVKVQGNIVKDLFGGVLAMTAITAQEGGKEGGTTPGGEVKEFFFENVAPDDVTYPSKERPKVNAHTAWKMGSPVKYSETTNSMDIRTTSELNASIWIAGNKPGTFKIEGIEGQGYSSIKLSYKLAAGALTAGQKTNINEIKVKANGQDVTIPSTVIDVQNIYTTVTVDVPNDITTLEFITASTFGFRLDDIKLVGTK